METYHHLPSQDVRKEWQGRQTSSFAWPLSLELGFFARGFTQLEDVDYSENFAPVAPWNIEMGVP